MKTRDGADFHLGMTLVMASGRELPTDDKSFRVRDLDGRPLIERVDSLVSYDLRMFYSSRLARKSAILNRISNAISYLKELQDQFKTNPDQTTCFHCLETDTDDEMNGECPYCGKLQAEPVEFHMIPTGMTF